MTSLYHSWTHSSASQVQNVLCLLALVMMISALKMIFLPGNLSTPFLVLLVYVFAIILYASLRWYRQVEFYFGYLLWFVYIGENSSGQNWIKFLETRMMQILLPLHIQLQFLNIVWLSMIPLWVLRISMQAWLMVIPHMISTTHASKCVNDHLFSVSTLWLVTDSSPFLNLQSQCGCSERASHTRVWSLMYTLGVWYIWHWDFVSLYIIYVRLMILYYQNIIEGRK